MKYGKCHLTWQLDDNNNNNNNGNQNVAELRRKASPLFCSEEKESDYRGGERKGYMWQGANRKGETTTEQGKRIEKIWQRLSIRNGQGFKAKQRNAKG